MGVNKAEIVSKIIIDKIEYCEWFLIKKAKYDELF